jgi:archaellum component FlaC
MDIVESVFAVIGVGFTVAFLYYLGSCLWDKIGAKGKDIEALENKCEDLEMRIDVLQSEVDMLTDDINTQLDMLRSKKR